MGAVNSLASQLIRDEGVVLHAYRDHLGFLTIGVGRLIDERRGGCITRDEALHLLSNDIARKQAEMDEKLPWWRGLDEVRQGALTNMAFQLGVTGLCQFATTLKHVQDGNWLEASASMLQSRWAAQTPERANRIALQWVTGAWQ
jgi:lysozyme